MKINTYHLVEGAKQATGLTVIIDVFRAFSVDCYLASQGANKIIPVGALEVAYLLKEEHPEYILIGERNERKPEGFDHGNSPLEVKDRDFSGKTIVHTTSAGTQGLVNAIHAEEVITGSFVNAGAIVRYIRSRNPHEVSLVGMGYGAMYPIEEDTACMDYIENELLGKENDFEAMKEMIRNTSGKRFFEPDKQDHAPREDFDLCLNLNRFDFVLKRYTEDEHAVLKKITI
jgi:2-phosphosulfolactate phosphatase